jgi:prepilin-type N-terminal cleavage/methylation domain-containing protein
MTRAFTLLEVLLAIAIVTIAGAIGVGVLSTTSTAAELLAVESELVALDRTGRIAAQTGSPCILRSLDDHELALLRMNERISEASFATNVSISFLDDQAQRLELIRFDRCGQSDDYQALITLGNAERRLTVAGLTGLTTRQDQP